MRLLVYIFIYLVLTIFGGARGLYAQTSGLDSVERIELLPHFSRDGLEAKGRIHFVQGKGRYAFDAGQEDWYARSVKLRKWYTPFDKDYIAPWKYIPKGKRDIVEAQFVGEGIEPNTVQFALEDGQVLPATYQAETRSWMIELPGVGTNEAYALYALIQGKTAGKLRVMSYPESQYTIRLIPVNGQSLSDIQVLETEVNRIFNPVGVSFNFKLAEGFENKVDRSNLSAELKRLGEEYQSEYSLARNEFCLFVLDKDLGAKDKFETLEGLMPRKSRFGYIFAGNSPNVSDLARSIAHELGHGLFTLKHTFNSEYGGKKWKEQTSNLMDYTKREKERATALAAYQWNAIANPAIFTGLDKVSDAQSHYVSVGRFLDWLRANRTRSDVQYQKSQFNQGFSLFDVPLKWELSKERTIWLYVELDESGVVDFSVNEKNIAKAVYFSVDLNNKYHTGFCLSFSYQGKANEKRKAIKLWCYDYNDFKTLLNYIGYSDIPAEYTISSYKKALQKAGDDCNQLDVIYETAPSFVLDTLEDNIKLAHLKSLSTCDISNRVMQVLIGRDTDEEKAVLNIISHIKDRKTLYSYLNTHPQVLTALYRKVDGEKNRELLLKEILKTCTTYWEEAGENLERSYKRDNILYFSNGTQTHGRLSDTRVSLWSFEFTNPITKRPISLTAEASHELLAPVYLNFTQEVDGRANQYSVVPAIYAYYLSEQLNLEHSKRTLDWALMSVSIYGSAYTLINSTGKVAKVIAWAGLLNDTTRLFFDNSRLKAYIETQPWGEDFIKAYYILSSGIDIANITHGVHLATIRQNSSKVRSVLVENKVNQKSLQQFDKLVRKLEQVEGIKIPTQYRPLLPESSYHIISIKEGLDPKIAETFKDSFYYAIKVDNPFTVYRRFGGNAKLLGSYVSTVPELSRQDLALLKRWNNMQFEAEIVVPRDATLYVGKIAEQEKYKGGADQILLPRAYPTLWIKRIRDLKTRKEYSFDEFIRIYSNK